MFKLYYSPGSCALASHITLQEAGADYRAERIDFKANQQNSRNISRSIQRGGCLRWSPIAAS
jgi:glutathione S-transferase